MQLIGENTDVINYCKGNYALLDATVTEFKIYTDDYLLHIDVYFQLLRVKNDIRLIFKDVVEYAFYHNNKHIFYNVERLKFFVADELIYLSLDPELENDVISEQDNDIILSKSVMGYIVDRNQR